MCYQPREKSTCCIRYRKVYDILGFFAYIFYEDKDNNLVVFDIEARRKPKTQQTPWFPKASHFDLNPLGPKPISTNKPLTTAKGQRNYASSITVAQRQTISLCDVAGVQSIDVSMSLIPKTVSHAILGNSHFRRMQHRTCVQVNSSNIPA